MTREVWLEKEWQRYPAAQNGWWDVADFSKAKDSLFANDSGERPVVAGRLSKSAGRFELESGGVRLELTLANELKWIVGDRAAAITAASVADDLRTPPTGDLFSTGDLIAVRVESGLIVTEILLLAPSSENRELNVSFDIGRSQNWMDFLQAIRDFFRERNFLDVQTPTLVPSPGTEPFLDAFKTEWELGSKTQTFYLPTSPEFHLKQLLSRGWSRVFELKTCFRNGEIGEHHQPEFLMLEWYRAYANLDSIERDVDELLQELSGKFARAVPRLKRTTIADLFARHYDDFNLTPATTVEELRDLAQANEVAVQDDDSFDDVFFRLFLDRIEPRLGANGPLLVSHYPPSQAALSRIGPHGYAERFEVYWRGLELANALHELNDPRENEKRFADDAAKKRELAKPSVPRDENLVRALQKGMPPSGGIALGVDRLFMALFGLETIAQTRAFPLTRLY